MRGWALACAGVLVVVGLSLAGARSRPAPAMPAPNSTRQDRSDERLNQNDACEGCHAAIADEWRASLHRGAYTDPMVQAAVAREAKPEFCRTCHAPEADPRTEPSARRAEIGVGCVGCHVVDDAILAGPAAPGQADVALAHAVKREAAFAGPQACAGCHEFLFPAAGRGGHGLKMQKTISEHARSNARAQPCQACHMQPTTTDGAVHRSHGFHVVGQPQLLRAAASISAERASDEHGQPIVRVTLEPRSIGHAFPTGDVFRRLVVRLDSDDDRCVTERYLAREFGRERLRSGAVITVEVDDDRVGVGVGPRIVEFVLAPTCANQPLRWSVAHQRVLHTPNGAEHDAVVWDQTVLASETLP